MRWCTYSTGAGLIRTGLVEGDTVLGLDATVRLVDLLATPDGLEDAARVARCDPAETVSLAQVTLHAPVPEPPSVRDFMAFEEHVASSAAAAGRAIEPLWYEIPAFYFSNPVAVSGPGGQVRIPPGTRAFDYELEVAAVVGVPGGDIPAAEADRHIAGYMVMCDWSARDLQASEMALRLGPAKGKDSATSTGPYLVTPDELEPFRKGNAYDLRMTAAVNGRAYSDGNLADIHWSFNELIEHASRGTRLRTGDILGSGTVGTGCILELSRSHGGAAYPWLEPGDRVELHVGHLGSIDVTIAASEHVSAGPGGLA